MTRRVNGGLQSHTCMYHDICGDALQRPARCACCATWRCTTCPPPPYTHTLCRGVVENRAVAGAYRCGWVRQGGRRWPRSCGSTATWTRSAQTPQPKDASVTATARRHTTSLAGGLEGSGLEGPRQVLWA